MVKGMLFVGVGWHVWVSLVVVEVLGEVELIVVSFMVSVGLFRLELVLAVVMGPWVGWGVGSAWWCPVLEGVRGMDRSVGGCWRLV
jgi:hypothetical protein